MRNVVRALLAMLVVVIGVAVATPVQALPGLPDPCDFAPSGPIQDACRVAEGVANPVDAVTGAVGAVGTVADAAGVELPGPAYLNDALNWLTDLFAATVHGALAGLGQMLAATPGPPIDQEWFAQEYAPLIRVGMTLSFLMALGYFAWFGLRGRTSELWHSFKLFLVAITTIAIAPLLIRMALQAADALTSGFAHWGGVEAGQFTDKITEVTSGVSGGGDGVQAVVGPVVLLLFLFFSVCMVIVWMVLLTLRSELIYMGTLAIPFVLPSIIDGYGRFARIYFKVLFGLIITKPILVGTLCAGAWLVERGAFGTDGIQALIAGFTIFLVATVGCMFMFKLLGLATPVVLAIERGGQRVAGGVRSATAVAAGAVTGAVTGDAAGGAAAGAITATSQERTPPPRPRGGP